MTPTTTIATYNDLARADAARSVLESAGLSPSLLDENMGRLHWGILPVLGGFRLQVPAGEADLAREILSQETTEGETGAEADPEIVWPARRRRNRVVVVLTFLLFLVPYLLWLLSGW